MYTSDARQYHHVSTQRVTESVQATEVVGAPAVPGGQPPLLLFSTALETENHVGILSCTPHTLVALVQTTSCPSTSLFLLHSGGYQRRALGKAQGSQCSEESS